MLAIADGGSTKADWRFLHTDGTVLELTTTGFNPNYDSQERITGLLETELKGLSEIPGIKSVCYYGTGCWDPGRKKMVKQALSSVFINAEIHVFHDLLGAARSTCGNHPGIVCILGTGSSSLYYDGKEEADIVPSLGFLLGDEGSGSHIGKELVKSYFYRDMPDELKHVIEAECPLGKSDILDKVYGGGIPAAYLATFAGRFHPHREHPFVKNLVASCFRDFLYSQVFKYEYYRSLPVHFVGSIAYHFKDILLDLLKEENLTPGKVLQKPIDELLNYHMIQYQENKPCS